MHFVKICSRAAYILYMELSFQQLKQKDVVSVSDGKNLGKVCDVTVSFPEKEWLGITVPGSKGFKLTNKREMFIPVHQIVKVGEDAVLVKTEGKKDCPPPPKDDCPPPCPPRPPKPRRDDGYDRRDYGEYE